MKNLAEIKAYLLEKKAAEETYPFGPEAMVFKVQGKLFAIVSEHAGGVIHINLKCDPDEAQALRDVFESVKPGYHMNKKHWNTVFLPGDVPAGELMRMIDQSYGLVVNGLTRAMRAELDV
ncbi:hypothetical protein A9Q81_05605 [Gammaproteobacteria bacterium 42_54_T18]|nr:hypothetical protein A9Q81_05605 [Gammaproteobacteria bacterium 42_54_T18]